MSGNTPAYLDIMNNLSTPDPARQADLFYEVEREYTRAPTTASTLRYAVALVTPGHPASSPLGGQTFAGNAAGHTGTAHAG